SSLGKSPGTLDRGERCSEVRTGHSLGERPIRFDSEGQLLPPIDEGEARHPGADKVGNGGRVRSSARARAATTTARTLSDERHETRTGEREAELVGPVQLEDGTLKEDLVRRGQGQD